MKPYTPGSTSTSWTVAPRAGAWVETTLCAGEWARRKLVAPRAGAWVETIGPPLCFAGKKVAPRAGAWVETINCCVPYYPNH